MLAAQMCGEIRRFCFWPSAEILCAGRTNVVLNATFLFLAPFPVQPSAEIKRVVTCSCWRREPLCGDRACQTCGETRLFCGVAPFRTKCG